MSAIEWYYAKGNRQCGPIGAAELKLLADRGELAGDDLVWRAGMDDWVPARKVRGLFDAQPAPPPQVSDSPRAGGGQPPAAPLSLSPEIGDAPPADAAGPSKPAARSANAAFERSTAAFERSREGNPQHFFDYLLESARSRFAGPFVEAAARLFAMIGHYGLYAAMFVLLAFHVAWAVKDRGMASTAVGVGLASILALALLQYSAGRFSGALEKLDRATSGQMSSTAYLDCFALLQFLTGLAALVGFTLAAAQFQKYYLVFPAVATFVVCQYAAVVALNPETLRLTITPDTRVSEEAVGVATFSVKLVLRIGPVAFGVGIVWGTLMMVRAGYYLFYPPAAAASNAGGLVGLLSGGLGGSSGPGMGPLPGEVPLNMPSLDLSSLTGQISGMSALPPHLIEYAPAMWTLFLAAALPVLIYFFFLSAYVLVDLLRVFLGIGRKLDAIVDEKKSEEG